jgi:hypothetical protein
LLPSSGALGLGEFLSQPLHYFSRANLPSRLGRLPVHHAAICRKFSLNVGVRRAGAGTTQKLGRGLACGYGGGRI